MRPTAHPAEFCVLDPVQPDPKQAPLFYRAVNPPLAVEPNGKTVACPSTFSLLPTDAGEPQHVTVLKTVVTSNGEEWTQQVWSGNRTGIITRWRTTCRVGGKIVFDLPWLAEGGPTGSGNGLNLDEQQHEHWQDPALHREHDPTMGGSGQVAWMNPATPAGDHVRLYGGHVLHYKAIGGVHQCCVAPMEFSAGNQMAGDFADNGGDDFHPVLRWRKRMWSRLRMNFQGRPCIHKVDAWSYDPEDWTGKDALYYLPLSMACVGRVFDRGYYGDFGGSLALTEIAGFAPPSTAPFAKAWDCTMGRMYFPDDGTPAAAPAARSRRAHRAARHAAITRGLVPPPGPSPMPSGYGCAVLHRNADGFCVALITKLVPPTDNGVGTTDDLKNPAMFTIVQNLYGDATSPTSRPGDEFNNDNLIPQVFSKTNRMRARGWYALQAFIYTGRFDQLGATLRDVKTSGAFDAPVEALPADVRASV